MKHLLLILSSVLLAYCGRASDSAPIIENTLLDRYHLYTELSARNRDENGFIHAEDNDSLLYSALLASVTGPINIEAARNIETGQWFRNPSHPKYDSVTDSGPKSTISRDMLLGLMFYIWKYQRLDLAQDLWKYGEEHNWKMGEDSDPFDPRSRMTPSLISTLAQMIYAMGGSDYSIRHFPAAYSTTPGYQSHLSMIHLYLRTLIAGGGMGLLEFQALETIVKKNPENALAQALWARYGSRVISNALRLLEQWPADRLPNNRDDWCTLWKVSKKDSDITQKPCPEEPFEEWSGGDFLFTYAVLTGRI